MAGIVAAGADVAGPIPSRQYVAATHRGAGITSVDVLPILIRMPSPQTSPSCSNTCRKLQGRSEDAESSVTHPDLETLPQKNMKLTGRDKAKERK